MQAICCGAPRLPAHLRQRQQVRYRKEVRGIAFQAPQQRHNNVPAVIIQHCSPGCWILHAGPSFGQRSGQKYEALCSGPNKHNWCQSSVSSSGLSTGIKTLWHVSGHVRRHSRKFVGTSKLASRQNTIFWGVSWTAYAVLRLYAGFSILPPAGLCLITAVVETSQQACAAPYSSSSAADWLRQYLSQHVQHQQRLLLNPNQAGVRS